MCIIIMDMAKRVNKHVDVHQLHSIISVKQQSSERMDREEDRRKQEKYSAQVRDEFMRTGFADSGMGCCVS